MDPGLQRSQTQSRGSTRQQGQGHQSTNSLPQTQIQNGAVLMNGSSSRPGTSHGANEAPGMVNPTTHKTMLKVGDNAYEVDLSKDPQQQQQQQQGRAQQNRGPAPGVGDESDPFYRQMANLRSGAGGSAGPGAASLGRTATRRGTTDSIGSSSVGPGPGSATSARGSALNAPPPSSPSTRADYRKSAELVVGAYPGPGGGSSRPTSPNEGPQPVTASFMKPPAPVTQPTVLQTYEQSFPEERDQRRRSFSNSRPPSFNGPQQSSQQPQHLQQVQGQELIQRPTSQNMNLGLDRPVSREGHAGIGANGRSRSPSIGGPITHGPGSTRSVSPSPSGDYGYGGGQGLGISQNQQLQQQNGFQQRAVSPNSVGIALDPSGKVALDSMADQYMQQQRQQQQRIPPPQAQPPQQQLPPLHSYQQQQPALQAPGGPQGALQRRTSMQRQTSVNYGQQPPQQQQGGYGGAVVHHGGYGSQSQPSYMQPPQSQSPVYAGPPSHPYATATSPVGQQPVFHPPSAQQAPPPQQQPYSNGVGLQRGPSMSVSPSSGGDYYSSPQRQQAHHSYGSSQSGGYGGGYGGGGRAISPAQMDRSQSPAMPLMLQQSQQQGMQQKPMGPPPTRQYTEDGRGVLFYGAFFPSFFSPQAFFVRVANRYLVQCKRCMITQRRYQKNFRSRRET